MSYERDFPAHNRPMSLVLVRVAILTALLLGPAVALVGAKEALGTSRSAVPLVGHRLGQLP